MVTLDQRYEKDPRIVARTIDGETILVPIRNDVGDLESIYTLNEMGARIWDAMDSKKTLSDISLLIEQEYDVTSDKVNKDLIEFVNYLKSINALIEVNS